MYAACLDVSRLDIVQAHDGLQALDQARALQPDLIVTDLAIPGIDGFELCRRLQADVRTREIPLIAITGQYVTPRDVERARRLGCGQVLLKPCLPDRLMAVVQETLHRRPRRQPPAV
jgi:CheY-like chemotaxis protein